MADTGKTIGLIKALASVDPEAIKSSVDDWLDDHPEATTTVEDGAITKAKLDSSLQQTVDDVGDLKSKIFDLQDNYLVFNTVDGEYVKSDGTTDRNTAYIRSDYISCEGLATITIIGIQTTTYYGAFYNANKEFISYITLVAGEETLITVPNGAAYYRISGEKSKGYFSTVKILAPSFFTTKQVEYNHAYLYSLLEQLTNDQEWMIGKYVDYQTGEIKSAGAWNAIEIVPSCGYMTTNANGNSAGGIVFLDSSDNVLLSYHNMGETARTYAVPVNTAKIRLCYNVQSAAQTDVFVVGGKVTFDGEKLQQMYDVISPNYKKMAVIGDSISSNNATGIVPVNYLAWPAMLIEKCKCQITYQNLTYPGKRLYEGLVADCNSVTSDTDIVFVALGRNDIGRGYTMGDVGEIMALPLEDVTTNSIIGVYRKGLETLKNRLKNEAIIVCIAPITEQLIDTWEQSTNPNWHATWEEMNELRESIKDFVLAEGGPGSGWFYINGRDIFDLSETAMKLYYGKKANGDPDSTHLNLCGEAIYASAVYEMIPPIGAISQGNWIPAQ